MGTYKKYIGKSIEIREGNTYVGDQQFDIPTNPLDQHSIYFELTKICIGRKVEDLCEEDETKDQFRTNCSIYAHGITTGNGFYESRRFTNYGFQFQKKLCTNTWVYLLNE